MVLCNLIQPVNCNLEKKMELPTEPHCTVKASVWHCIQSTKTVLHIKQFLYINIKNQSE